MYSIFLIKPQR